MRPEDAGRWAEVLAAAEEVDRRGQHYGVDDCRVELADPELDLGRDTRLVLDGERAAACQVLWVRGGAGSRTVHVDGVVHPDYRRRGIGAALIEVARRRAAELGAGLQVRVPERGPGPVALVERAGLVPVRWWAELERDLAEPVTAVPLADGLVLHRLGPGYDGARWNEPLRAARNSSFAEHFGSVPESSAAFVHRRITDAFRAECSAAACTPDGDVAGFVLSQEFAAATARTGRRDLYVDTVGTVPAWRGRGVAAALLAQVLMWAREAGFASSSLTVDADNPTGALGVYARAGYRVDRREVTYTLPR